MGQRSAPKSSLTSTSAIALKRAARKGLGDRPDDLVDFPGQFGIAIGANQYSIPDLGGRRHGVDVCRPPNEPAGPWIFDERRRKHDALDLLAKLFRDANRNRTGKRLAEQENLPLANRIADKLGISGIPQCRVWRIANDAYVQIFRKKWRDPVK